MDLNTANQNIDQPSISYSVLEQYIGTYTMKNPQEDIQIKVSVKGNDLYVSFDGIKGLKEEKLVYNDKAEQSFGHAESFTFQSNPNCTAVFLTTSYKHSGKNNSLIITLPEKQIIAKKV